VYARVTNLRFPPAMRTEIVSVARGLVPVLARQRGFQGLHILTESDTGEGILVSFWETEADTQTSESDASYIGQMSMMSSFLYGALTPQTYEANVLV
jgi:heme-degrading monooxygenase HmoA